MNDPVSGPLPVPTEAMHRYAAYYAPEVGSPWWEFGSHWLGRCAATGESRPQPPIAGISHDLQRRLTAAPRRYGWHATLKSPFALAPHTSEAELQEGIGALCRAWDGFELPTLQVVVLDEFLALVTSGPCPPLDRFAEACVVELHPFAAALSASEVSRRRATGLSPEEDALLLRWGYPFVLDKFRFHLSLTGSLLGASPDVVGALKNAAREAVHRLPPCRFDAVSLFAEPRPGSDFTRLDRIPLRG